MKSGSEPDVLGAKIIETFLKGAAAVSQELFKYGMAGYDNRRTETGKIQIKGGIVFGEELGLNGCPSRSHLRHSYIV